MQESLKFNDGGSKRVREKEMGGEWGEERKDRGRD